MADKGTSEGEFHVPARPNCCSHGVLILNRCENCGGRKEGDEWADEDDEDEEDAEDEESDDDNEQQEVAIVTDTEVSEQTGYENQKFCQNCDACKKEIKGMTVFLNCNVCNKKCCWNCARYIAHPLSCDECGQRSHDECAPMCHNCNRSACAHCFGEHLVCSKQKEGCQYTGCMVCYNLQHDCIYD